MYLILDTNGISQNIFKKQENLTYSCVMQTGSTLSTSLTTHIFPLLEDVYVFIEKRCLIFWVAKKIFDFKFWWPVDGFMMQEEAVDIVQKNEPNEASSIFMKVCIHNAK